MADDDGDDGDNNDNDNDDDDDDNGDYVYDDEYYNRIDTAHNQNGRIRKRQCHHCRKFSCSYQTRQRPMSNSARRQKQLNTARKRSTN